MSGTNNSISVKNRIADKHGFSKIQWCILLVVLVVIMAFILSYVVAVNIAESQKKIATQALDAFVEENAIRIYSEVKQNSDYTKELLEEEFLERLVEINGLIAHGTEKYASLSSDGKSTQYIITKPKMEFEEDYSAKVMLSYTISVPLEFNGGPAIWVDIPITITSRFMPKYEAEEDQKDTEDKTPPLVTISVPNGTSQASPYVTPYDTIAITGVIQDEGLAYVSVNGDRVSVSEGGVFQQIVILEGGLNVIQVTAADRMGNSTTRYIYVSKEGAKPLDVAVDEYTGIYDGNPHSISVTSTQSAFITYSLTQDGSYTSANPTFTNAGTYRVYYRVAKDGYETKTGSAIVRIDKAENNLSAMPGVETPIDLQYPESFTFPMIGNPSGGTISVSVNDPTLVTISNSGNQIFLTALNKTGATTILVTAAETTNYKAGTWSAIVHVTSCDHSDVYTEGYVEAKCTTAGYTGDIRCHICNDRVEEGSIIPALNHDYSAKVASKEYEKNAQSCTEAATYYYKCSRCDSKGTERWTDGEPAGHDLSGKGSLMENATCTSGPKYFLKCVREGCLYQSQEKWMVDGEALGHSYAEATCTTDKHCTRSGCLEVIENTKLGHSYAEATCTTDKHCTRSGCSEVIANTKLGHSFSSKSTDAQYKASSQSCTTAETFYFKCTRCAEKGTSTWINKNALDHDWAAATCTTDKYCKRSGCGATVAGTKLGHNYTEATCTTDKHCTRSGCSEVIANTKLGHNFSSKSTDAQYKASSQSCTTAETFYFKCIRCAEKGTSTWTNKNALDHDWVAATCTTDKYCKRSGCGVTVAGTKTAHTPSGTVTKYDTNYHYQKCSGCGTECKTAHTKSSSLSYDGNNHWYPCTTSGCKAHLNETNHTLSYYNVNGSYHTRKCSCGYSTGNVSHSYTYSSVNDTHHSGKCVCGATTSNETHSFDYEDIGDYVEHSGTCSKCGYSTTFQHELKSGSGTGYCTICGGYARL